jgi:hypothetical protein
MARKKDAANAVMSSAILRVRENSTRIVSVPADATTARPMRYCSFTERTGLRVAGGGRGMRSRSIRRTGRKVVTASGRNKFEIAVEDAWRV